MLSPSGRFVRATNYNLTNNATSFVLQTSGPGVAVLTETFLANDFRATLNGRRVPFFRVNHAFKALTILSAGTWVVKFEYRPPHWDLSLTMAALGIVVLVGLGVSARRCRYVDTALSENPAARASS
jgi:hypothetical protein